MNEPTLITGAVFTIHEDSLKLFVRRAKERARLRYRPRRSRSRDAKTRARQIWRRQRLSTTWNLEKFGRCPELEFEAIGKMAAR